MLQTATMQAPPSLALPVGSMAACALVAEVNLTPKPGLVDRANNGAHSDMNRQLFIHSAAALRPYFCLLTQAGLEHGESLFTCFDPLTQIGIQAEQAMFVATGGVNTHKGALFSVGLLCAAAGILMQRAETPSSVRLFECAATLVNGRVQRDYAQMRSRPPQTSGEQLFVQQGVVGVRGEAAAGFPSVRWIALPALRQALREGISFEKACLQALLCLLAQVEDTNVLHRSDQATLHWLQEQAQQLLSAQGMHAPDAMARLQALDADCIRRNISPGGCADLLALSIFVHFLETRGQAYGWTRTGLV